MQFPSTRKSPNLSPGKYTSFPTRTMRQTGISGPERCKEATQHEEHQRVPEFATDSRTNPKTTDSARNSYAFPYPYEIRCHQAISLTTRVLNPEQDTMPCTKRSTNHSPAAPAAGMVEPKFGLTKWVVAKQRMLAIIGLAQHRICDAGTKSTNPMILGLWNSASFHPILLCRALAIC
jgi:hypothetical protein